MKPFYAFVEKSFSGLANPNNTNDKETGKPFTKCAIELFPEKKSSEDAGEEPSMKTEAELVAAQKDKPAKVDPTPDVVFAVTYIQDSLQTTQAKAMNGGDIFGSNVFGFADADFDMDLDANFHESESFFFEKLGFTKREDEDEDENDSP